MVLLSSCSTTKSRTYPHKEFELLEPIVFIKIPEVGIDTSFTKDYIRDFVDIVAYHKNLTIKKVPFQFPIDIRYQLIHDIDSLRATKKPMPLSLKKYGYTPQSKRTMILFHTGSEETRKSSDINWKDVAVMSLTGIASGGHVVLYPTNQQYNSMMRCVIVNNQKEIIEYVYYDHGSVPLMRDIVEGHVEHVLQKIH